LEDGTPASELFISHRYKKEGAFLVHPAAGSGLYQFAFDIIPALLIKGP
jgi:hypothetical protein